MTPLEDAERNSRLWHIAEAAESLLRIAGEHTVDEYVSNIELRWAIERGLSVIGEAASRLRKVDPEVPITAIDAIVGFRNRLIHDYPAIEPREVWSIVVDEVPRLLAEVRVLLPPV